MVIFRVRQHDDLHGIVPDKEIGSASMPSALRWLCFRKVFRSYKRFAAFY
jgi:hypothetical protein